MDYLSSIQDNAPLKIVIISNIKEIPEILDDWRRLLLSESYKVPGIDPDHYLFELKSLGKTAEPYIICFYQNEKLSSILLARIETTTLPMRLGYLTLVKVPVKKIHIFHGGFIGQKDKMSCLFLYHALRKSLDSGKADLAIINHLHVDSIIHKTIKSNAPLFKVAFSPRKDGHWLMEVPDSIESFYMKKPRKQRYNLQREIKKLEKTYLVSAKKYINEEHILEGLKAASLVSSKSFQSALDTGLFDNDKTRLYCQLTSRIGWIRIYLLYINNEPAAYEWGLKYGDTFFLKTIGFDPKWKKESAGKVLFQKVLKDLIESERIRLIDFGFGDAEYKRHFATKRLETQSLFIFGKKPYSLFLSLTSYVLNNLWKLLIYFTQILRMEAKLKRIWKDRLGS